jgi:Uncharacterized protein conserved in bacteria (DUF2252)
MNIIDSARHYERWLKSQLKGDIFKQDLEDKHAKMAADAFQFLRATYWRWAETILEICPALKGAPHVLAVGDIHVENFGTWRDSEGRLVWGVNDFDEAAKMPYGLDIVRLAVSAVLARVRGVSARTICANILKGYSDGLDDPKPYVLDRRCAWLREIVVVSDDDRKDFWKEFDPQRIKAKSKKDKARQKLRPPRKMRPHYVKALDGARPDSTVTLAYFERTAGTGSLGRPRYVGIGEWGGDRIVREAKAMVRSGWVLAHHGPHDLRCEEIARGKYRSPDPFYHLRRDIVLRRLTPNDYKIEANPKEKKDKVDALNTVPASVLVNPKMLQAMGRDIASIHRGTPDRHKAIVADLAQRDAGWLLAAVKAATRSIKGEWREWRAHEKKKAAKTGKKTAKRA